MHQGFGCINRNKETQPYRLRVHPIHIHKWKIHVGRSDTYHCNSGFNPQSEAERQDLPEINLGPPVES